MTCKESGTQVFTLCVSILYHTKSGDHYVFTPHFTTSKANIILKTLHDILPSLLFLKLSGMSPHWKGTVHRNNTERDSQSLVQVLLLADMLSSEMFLLFLCPP